MKDNPKQIDTAHQCYAQLKYQEAYNQTVEKCIEFFTLKHMKQFLNWKERSKYEKQMTEEVLRQVRLYLKKKAMVRFGVR